MVARHRREVPASFRGVLAARRPVRRPARAQAWAGAGAAAVAMACAQSIAAVPVVLTSTS